MKSQLWLLSQELLITMPLDRILRVLKAFVLARIRGLPSLQNSVESAAASDANQESRKPIPECELR